MTHLPQDPQWPAYRLDQIVVGLKHADLVSTALASLGAAPTSVSRESGLGLALVEFDAAAALHRVRETSETTGKASPFAVDDVMRHLRTHFQARYGGWAPAMGKNRTVSRVVGTYHLWDGGTEGPTAIAAPVPPALRNPRIGPGSSVGIIDTAMHRHEWLDGAVLASPADLANPGGGPAATHHGTFVAGAVLSQAPGAVVHFVGGLGSDGSADSWDIACRIVELSRVHGLDVINLSLGCTTEDGQAPLVLKAAIAALAPETLVIAAAGNHGTVDGYTVPAPSFPAALDEVVSIGAEDGQGDPASFSPDTPWVDGIAPGVEVVSTYVSPAGTSGYARWSGTSFAAALVSGMVAARTRDGVPARAAWGQLVADAPTDASGRPRLSPAWPALWPKA